MSKAFTKEPDDTLDDDDELQIKLPQKNYVTPFGLEKLRQEYKTLVHDERPKIVEIVSWAAGNGDRSENGDYIYGKKRLREIDRRLRYLSKQIDNAVLVDPKNQQGLQQVFFGATVTYADEAGDSAAIKIVGIDEADIAQGKTSFLSPLAQALLKAKKGDTVRLRTPAGETSLDVLSIAYVAEDCK